MKLFGSLITVLSFSQCYFFLWHSQCLGTHSSSMLLVIYGCFAMSNI